MMKGLTDNYKVMFTQDLSQLVQIPSVLVNYVPDTTLPSGENIQAALDLMLSIRERDVFHKFSVDDYASVIEMGLGEEIGILGHLDVVPVQDGWSVRPFFGEIKDGWLVVESCCK